MIEYENQCVGCEPHMGCLGDSCPHVNVPVYLCDKCGVIQDPDDGLRQYGSDELCQDCLRLSFTLCKDSGGSTACEECGDDFGEVYTCEGVKLCSDCLVVRFPLVEAE